MAQVHFKGNPVTTKGDLPEIGSNAPSFKLTAGDLSDVSLADYAGQKVVLNIFPSIDTPTCATSVRKFNQEAAALDGTKVLCISADLPFAAGRFCAAEGLENVITLSTFRSPEFGTNYGISIEDSALRGLLARAVVVLSSSHTVLYTELVNEIADEPNYAQALKALA